MRLNNEILSIRNKKNTLALSCPEIIIDIPIGGDTYFYLSSTYVEQLTAYPTVNPGQKSRLQFIGSEKQVNGYGYYSNASAVESITNVDVKNAAQPKIEVDENQIYSSSNICYLFTPAKRLLLANKEIFDFFSKHRKGVNDCIGANNISFEKATDLDGFCPYAKSIVLLLIEVLFLIESPRWLIKKGQVEVPPK